MKARPGTRPRQFKLTDDECDALDAIAAREDLSWGGVPSRSEAVRWLILGDREKFHKGHVGDGRRDPVGAS